MPRRNIHVVIVTLLAVIVLSASPVAAQILLPNGEPDPGFNSNAMQLWYRADQGVDNPGGAVNQWNDQSNHGRNATAFSVDNQPIHLTNGLGGRQVIIFDDTVPPDYLDTGFDATNVFNDSFTLFSVIAPTDGTAEGNVWFGNFQANATRAFANIDGGRMSFIYQENTAGAVNNNPANPFPASPTEYKAFTWEVDAATDQHRVYFDDGLGYGLQQALDSSPRDHSTFNLSASPYLGAGNRADQGNIPVLPFGGGIAELILYKGVLSTADRIAVENYLTGGSVEPPTDGTWTGGATGAWTDSSNWLASFVPTTNDHTAKFADAISAPTTVSVDTPQTINAITFDHTVEYVIGGAASMNLEADTMPTPTLPVITVQQGDHQFQVVTNLLSDTTVNVASGSTLTFNHALNLMGNTLTKTGGGTLSIANDFVTDGGTLLIQEGIVSGNGTVGGDLNNESGTISPGNPTDSSSVVPEPSALVTVAIGLVMCFARLSRRRIQ